MFAKISAVAVFIKVCQVLVSGKVIAGSKSSFSSLQRWRIITIF